MKPTQARKQLQLSGKGVGLLLGVSNVNGDIPNRGSYSK